MLSECRQHMSQEYVSDGCTSGGFDVKDRVGRTFV